MAHIPASAAIFSPSVARLASTTAKDWNYVDSWLASKFHGRAPPPFERNPDTLKALVALAALNESADEDRELVARVESSSLQTLSNAGEDAGEATSPGGSATQDQGMSAADVLDSVLGAVSDGLTPEGRVALDSMAATAVELGIAYPEPELLGRRIIELQADVFQLEQAISRVEVLKAHIEDETAKSHYLLKALEGDEYRPAADLAKANLELQRKVKTETARLADGHSNTAGDAQAPAVTIQQVQEEERLYLELLAQKKELDEQIKAFHGLSPNKELALKQLEDLRADLRAVTQERDSAFEGLVERESPRRRR